MRHRFYLLIARRRVDDNGAVLYYNASEISDKRSLVTRLFVGYSMCLKALVLLGFSAQFAASIALANIGPNMSTIPTQIVVAGQLFSYRVVVNSAAAQPTGMRLINAPKGATLTDNGDGSHELRWIPPANVDEQTVIIVQAYSLAEPNLISTQRVILQRGSSEQVAVTDAASASGAVGAVVASDGANGSQIVTPSISATKPIEANTLANIPAENSQVDADKTATPEKIAKLVTDAPASVELKTSQLTPAMLCKAMLCKAIMWLRKAIQLRLQFPLHRQHPLQNQIRSPLKDRIYLKLDFNGLRWEKSFNFLSDQLHPVMQK